jgi:hypothetical protein
MQPDGHTRIYTTLTDATEIGVVPPRVPHDPRKVGLVEGDGHKNTVRGL